MLAMRMTRIHTSVDKLSFEYTIDGTNAQELQDQMSVRLSLNCVNFGDDFLRQTGGGIAVNFSRCPLELK